MGEALAVRHGGARFGGQGVEESRAHKLGGRAATVEGNLERAARSSKAASGAVCDGFQPQSPPRPSKETRSAIVKFLEQVEQCGLLRDDVFPYPKERYERTGYRFCPP